MTYAKLKLQVSADGVVSGGLSRNMPNPRTDGARHQHGLLRKAVSQLDECHSLTERYFPTPCFCCDCCCRATTAAMSNHSKSGKLPPLEIGDIEAVKDKSHHSLAAPQVAQVCSSNSSSQLVQPGSFQHQQQQQGLAPAHPLPQAPRTAPACRSSSSIACHQASHCKQCCCQHLPDAKGV